MIAQIDPVVNRVFANALNLIPELGPVKLGKLWKYFSNFQAAWEASSSDYRSAGLDEKTIERIITRKPLIKPEQSFEALERLKIKILLITDPDYPAILKEIPAPPPILYVRGNEKVLNKTVIAVVGTRKMSSYGRQAAQELVTGLVISNLTIVSGLAFGVDAEALNAALNAKAQCVAVLASSIDDASISPRANFLLAQKIIDNGCIISEYPLGSNVQKQNFPIRNRIISGLALGTLVVEADEESGALITANYSLEQNREVFAVPGSIFSPTSRGTNQLIKKGAKLVNSAFDILEELNLDVQTTHLSETFEESEEENMVLSNLTREPVHIDELILLAKLPASQVSAALTLLELKGRVKNLGGTKYIKVR